MSRHPDRAASAVVTDVFVIAELLKEPQPAQLYAYLAREGTREYTITPALIDAVGRGVTTEIIQTYVNQHGVAELATVLAYAIARERGQTTHRRVAQALDLSPLEAETILQDLHPVIHAHVDVKLSGSSVADIDDSDQETASVAETEIWDSTLSTAQTSRVPSDMAS